MKTSRIALAGALTIGLAAAAAGCGSGGTSTANNTPTTKPVSGGTIVYALPPATNINWYFPLATSGNNSLYNAQLTTQLYKPLIWINSKYTINYQSSIAQKITSNKSGTVYHVFMNPKWKWSDGTPVTSADVLWTWQIIQATSASNAPAPWPFVGAGSGDVPTGIQSVVANSKYEFTVTLKKPANQSWFIYNGLSDFMPLPVQDTLWNKYPNNITQEVKYLGQQATNPKFDNIVDGPYKLASATANQSWTLVPNPTYPGHKAYDKIILTYEGSNASEFAALKTGAVQVGYVDLSEYGARKELTSDNLFPSYGFDYNYLALNLNSKAQNGLGPVFQQLYVRQAMEMALNQQAVDTAIFHGYAPPQYGPIPTTPATAYLDPRLKKPIYPYSPSKAKKLLESHGWSMQNGVMTKNGLKLAFTIIYSSGNTSLDEQLALFQQNFAAIGIKVNLKPEPFATMLGIIANPADEGQWDAAGGIGIIYGGSYPTGQSLFGTGGGNNFAGYSSKKEDQLIAATHAPQPSTAANLQTYFNYEYYTAQQVPGYLWTNQVGTINAVATNVHNVQQYSNGLTGYPQFQYWWAAK